MALSTRRKLQALQTVAKAQKAPADAIGLSFANTATWQEPVPGASTHRDFDNFSLDELEPTGASPLPASVDQSTQIMMGQVMNPGGSALVPPPVPSKIPQHNSVTHPNLPVAAPELETFSGAASRASPEFSPGPSMAAQTEAQLFQKNSAFQPIGAAFAKVKSGSQLASISSGPQFGVYASKAQEAHALQSLDDIGQSLPLGIDYAQDESAALGLDEQGLSTEFESSGVGETTLGKSQGAGAASEDFGADGNSGVSLGILGNNAAAGMNIGTVSNLRSLSNLELGSQWKQNQAQSQAPPLGPVRVSPPKRIRGARSNFLVSILKFISTLGLGCALSACAFYFLAPVVLSSEELESIATEFNLQKEFRAVGLIKETEELDALVNQTSSQVGNESLSSSQSDSQSDSQSENESAARQQSNPSLDTDLDSPVVLSAQMKADSKNHTPKEHSSSANRSKEDLVPTANESYFIFALEALRSGDILNTVRLLQETPAEPFRMKYDLDMASMVAARFYLFLGNDKRAQRVLVERCHGTGRAVSIEVCLPLARAYVGIGAFAEASSLVQSLSKLPNAENYAYQFSLILEAIKFGSKITPQNVASHIAFLFAQNSTDLEWERQQSLWILHEIGLLGAKRWRDLAQIVLQLQRKDFDSSLNSELLSGSRLKNSAALTRFLEYLAVKYGYEKLPIEHGLKELPALDHKLALVLQAISANMLGKTEEYSTALHLLRGKKPYSEIERIIAMNSALQERRLSKAYHIMSSQVETISQSEFGFEWKLGAAHYAVDSNNLVMASKLYEAFQSLEKRKSPSTNSFAYWYARAKLEILLRTSPHPSIEKAESYAVSERERGLFEALKLEEFAQSKTSSAVNVSEVVQKYPWHFRLLSAAILAQGKLGLDPRKYIEMQNRVSSSRLNEGREQELLNDETLQRLISEI